jgi:hypothetical protein
MISPNSHPSKTSTAVSPILRKSPRRRLHRQREREVSSHHRKKVTQEPAEVFLCTGRGPVSPYNDTSRSFAGLKLLPAPQSPLARTPTCAAGELGITSRVFTPRTSLSVARIGSCPRSKSRASPRRGAAANARVPGSRGHAGRVIRCRPTLLQPVLANAQDPPRSSRDWGLLRAMTAPQISHQPLRAPCVDRGNVAGMLCN